MRLIPVLALSAVALSTLAPQPARAGDEAIAAIGGFIGGVIVGSHLDNDHRHSRRDHRRYREDHCPPPRVVIVDRDHHRPRGYWAEETVKVWVPDRWVWGVDDCGRRVRYRERGHYEYRRERVWVDSRRGRHG